MSQGTSVLQQQTLQHLRFCGIVCCQQNMCVLHASISKKYLQTTMTDYEYMQIPRHLVPQELIDEYGLERKIQKGFLYCEIQKGVYGLPQAGKLANTLLKQCIDTYGYI